VKVQLIGCSHHSASVAVRERLAFSPEQAALALEDLRREFPHAEAVLLSTCNRVELYTAVEDPGLAPSHHELAGFLARARGLALEQVFDDLFERDGEDAIRHLFTVAASLDSMVVGEPQISAQVKQAYQLASERQSAGPIINAVFQAALKVAKRVASETRINERRVSVPSIGVEFARQIFERFDDKTVVVIGAGEMGVETLRYLREEGVRRPQVVNRNLERAEAAARECHGQAMPWDRLGELLVAADLIISTTGASQPIVSLADYHAVERQRFQRPLFILDLAVPRDFDPAIGDCLGVYLLSLDNLEQTCRENLRERQGELPRALAIIEEETSRFMAELRHRATGPLIARLKQGWQLHQQEELRRLYNRLPDLGDRERAEIGQAFDRLINKLLHPPLELLRDESRHGTPHGLLHALKRLFRLED
jgi:glutamyl-tRNA reductase